ncbi:roadblock/LC7 domain-containing protein [Candidatus Parvarchaeota archaeon]|nr:roadblock/LC7 domain-containing protein [Candidatus Parvarchaeota archaeon]
MPTKSESIKLILESLSRTGGVRASAVISTNGLPIVNNIPESVDPNTFAAMLASMVGAAETALRALGSKNALDRVVSESKDVQVTAVKAGEDAILAIMTDPAVNWGLILLEARRSAEQIAQILKT